METNKQQLPKLADLHADLATAFKNDQFKTLLNQPPHASWLKRSPKATDYLPIDKVEFLLDRIFQDWQVEVKQTQILFNAVQVTVRLHYLHPVKNEWRFHDGVGSKELQTKKDSGPLKLDFSNVNAGAVEMATPIAKTQALKDAADHLGKLFGRDLNRKDTIEFVGSYNQEPVTPSAPAVDDNFKL